MITNFKLYEKIDIDWTKDIRDFESNLYKIIDNTNSENFYNKNIFIYKHTHKLTQSISFTITNNLKTIYDINIMYHKYINDFDFNFIINLHKYNYNINIKYYDLISVLDDLKHNLLLDYLTIIFNNKFNTLDEYYSFCEKYKNNKFFIKKLQDNNLTKFTTDKFSHIINASKFDLI